MAKIMVLGDTHGNTPFTTNIVGRAKRHDARHIIQVGDFGLWDHFEDGVRFLDALNEALRRDGTKLFAVGGNHENWVRWNWYIENNPKRADGWTYLRSHIYIAPKTMHWEWFNKRFALAAGAVSIDRDWRLEKERDADLGPNNLFWWDEQLLDADVDAMESKKVDFLFTHDCSNATPFKSRMKPDFESQTHRQRIDAVLRKTAPEVHFHGHMHTKYDWMNLHDSIVGAHYTQTYGFECDGMHWSWGILDTETEVFEFCPAKTV